MIAASLHSIARRTPRLLGILIALSAPGLSGGGAFAQGAQTPTSPTMNCPDPNPPFVMPPEFVSSGRILKGTINLAEQFIRLPTSAGGGTPTCAPQLVRTFQGDGLPPPPVAQPPAPAGYADPIPGPTLRARVGDLVQLTFINQVDSNRFDRNIDLEECTRVGLNGAVYPSTIDKYPDCLHASSTANIHFHGTHTSPSSTGDNVYLMIRPLPRDNQGNLTVQPAAATASLDDFFRICAQRLGANPLDQWPRHWNDVPRPYIDKQIEMLRAYEAQNPLQPLWTLDQGVLAAGYWPQYYIGAYPYCYALPAYTEAVWPPPPGSSSPIMGQAPGTHWYHAHKHGSTAINVGNGMTGVFVVEGKYDDDLNAFYGKYTLRNGPWNSRAQPIIVLNQLMTVPNRLAGSGDPAPDFVVNGRLRPVIQMQPGEVQLWRIANSAGRSAAYFMAPKDIQWRQIAQDGVQLADDNYQSSTNVPIYVAPGNRVDLLVKAPLQTLTTQIQVQNVVARGRVKPTPLPGSSDPFPGVPLLTVAVSGPQVQLSGQPAEMPFINRAPTQPPFLTDITDDELRRNNFATKTLDFNSKARNSPVQHTINGVQFEDGNALVAVQLGVAEEWTIRNSTGANPGLIDHPFHIHINPFQITEFFDPNENLVDPQTGQLLAVLQQGKTVPVPKYVVAPATPGAGQCQLNPDDPRTWRDCRPTKGNNLVWWDVFAIPSGRAVKKSDGTPVVIPGFFKMRSRFVDYPGLYVLHCHILIHEDRGMMFSVDVTRPRQTLLRHH